MGDLQAPPELWQGVRAQLIIDKLEAQQAPSELWDVVHAQLAEEGVTARTTKMFSLRPMYAAAAALEYRARASRTFVSSILILRLRAIVSSTI